MGSLLSRQRQSSNDRTVSDLSILIPEVEKKLLISWTPEITKKWFEYHLGITSSSTSLLQNYVDKLCTEYSFDGYGLSLITESFFLKISRHIIEDLIASIAPDSSRDSKISNPLSQIQSLWTEHIFRIQLKFRSEYPSSTPVLQNDPNMKYLDDIIHSKDLTQNSIVTQILEWYHYQSEHREGYVSRAQTRIWILQPSSCKRFYGEIPVIPLQRFESLELLCDTDPLSNRVLFTNNNSVHSHILDLKGMSCFIWYSLCLSSSKDSFHNFAMPKGAFSKRCNASSGGLHPVESYFIIPRAVLFENVNDKTSDLESESQCNQWIFCHYPVRQHALEILGHFEKIEEQNNESDDDTQKMKGSPSVFYVLLSTVDFREIWKYGERGLRYSLLDIGHALGALCIAAHLMGWQCHIASVASNTLQSVFNLPQSDHPRILLKVHCGGRKGASDLSSTKWNDIDLFSGHYQLKMNEYITETYPSLGTTWPILCIVQKYCFDADNFDDLNSDNLHSVDLEQKQSDNVHFDDAHSDNLKWINCGITMNDKIPEAIFSGYSVSPNFAIRHRRSALEFEPQIGKFNMFRDSCFLMKNTRFPFGYLCCYILYVIRVDNIKSGLYLLFPKHAEKYERIYGEYIVETTKLKPVTVELLKDTNDSLRLYLVKELEEEVIAQMSNDMACHQKLCANAAFTIDFCIDLEVALQSGNHYSICHWECGYIGQLLYVHMECHGLGATAIGCYLDDYASSNVGFLPPPPFCDNPETEKAKGICPDDLKRFDDWKHPLKNVRSFCHFSCGTPTEDLRYPYFAWDTDLFPFNAI